MYSKNVMNTNICTEYGDFNNMESLMYFMKEENLNSVKGQMNYWGAIIPFNYSYKEVCDFINDTNELVNVYKDYKRGV